MFECRGSSLVIRCPFGPKPGPKHAPEVAKFVGAANTLLSGGRLQITGDLLIHHVASIPTGNSAIQESALDQAISFVYRDVAMCVPFLLDVVSGRRSARSSYGRLCDAIQREQEERRLLEDSGFASLMTALWNEDRQPGPQAQEGGQA